MKEVTADFIRSEIARLGSVVIETGLYHPSGLKLHSAGEPLTLSQAKSLHESGIHKLHLLEFGEDERTAKKSLGIEHVLPAAAAAGDQLAEDIRKPNGELLLAAGTALDDATLEVIRSASILAVPIRHRKLAALTKQAEEYLAKHVEQTTAGFKEPVTRITRVMHATTAPARYLLIPRARVLVGIADDLLRTLIVNALTSEGHDPVERKSAGAAAEDVWQERPNILLLDLTESLALLPKLRGTEGPRNLAIIVCGDEERTAMIHNALYGGANDWVPRPPSRDVLNEKIKGCQDILLRRVQLAPSLRSERRRFPRQPVKAECSLRDALLTKPLPVTTGESVEISEGGIRLAYNVPKWPCPWAYTTHGVHPRHPFFAYAGANPGGQNLQVVCPGPKGVPIERLARVAHLLPGLNDIEVMGLNFPQAIEPKKPTTRKF
jgi:CheY-like chemotaxis protein